MIGVRPQEHETWWSLERVIVWMASERRLAESNELTSDLRDAYDFADLYDAATTLRYALIDRIVTGYGSLDTLPSAAISPTVWIGMSFVQDWTEDRIPIWGNGSPTSILTLSKEHYRAAALLDQTRPSGEMIESAAGEEPGFHRVISEVVFEAEKITQELKPKIMPSAKTKARATRKKGPLRMSLSEALATMVHRGQSLSNSMCGLTATAIARKVEKRWAETDGPHYELDTIRKNVERFYDDLEEDRIASPMSESEMIARSDIAIVRTIRR